jgi:hypothetical protein
MYSHGAVEERDKGGEPKTGRNIPEALKPLEGGMTLVNIVDE